MLELYECGDMGGKPCIYFHGAPGAVEECQLLDLAAKRGNRHIICFDRFSIDTNLSGAAYYKFIADAITAKVGNQKIDLIGFSIGAHVAIELNQILAGQVDELHLISAAAPLGAGDFLPHMAGKPIFDLAKNRSSIFSILVYFQSLIAKISPLMLFKMLFASASGSDKALIEQTEFKNFILPILKQSYTYSGRGFVRDVRLYVNWQMDLIDNNAATYIWHGESDNWSPVAMADYLENEFSQAKLINFPELSHYSTLYEVTKQIFAQKVESTN